MTSTQIASSGEDRLIPEPDAARMLNLSQRSLQRFRREGTGPSHVQVSARRVCYRLTDILAWANRRRAVSHV